MDRRAGLALLAACGGPPQPRHAETDAARVLARGTLGYAVAFAGERPISVELGLAFELVIRDDEGVETGRVALGGADLDWTALAANGARAWAAGEPGEVVEIALDDATVTARWPVGATVTALAASEDLVAIGDAEGVLCLRRTDDGALLQCVAAHDGAIRDLAITGDVLTSRGDDAAQGWRLPALELAPPDDESPIRVAGPRVERLTGDGPSLIVEMSGAVQDVAIAGSGRLAVAAWITALDQPSVVMVVPQR